MTYVVSIAIELGSVEQETRLLIIQKVREESQADESGHHIIGSTNNINQRLEASTVLSAYQSSWQMPRYSLPNKDLEFASLTRIEYSVLRPQMNPVNPSSSTFPLSIFILDPLFVELLCGFFDLTLCVLGC